MGDLFDAINDDGNDTSAAAPAPAEPAPETAAPAPAEPAPEPSPENAPKSDAAEPAPTRKLPAGVLDKKPPPDGEKSAKGKGKGKASGGVSHENRERFAETFGPLIDEGLNIVAVSVGSPVRADNANPRDPNNGLVMTVKFGPKAVALDTRREGVKEAADKARSTLGALFTHETPGRAVAYHAAAIAPGLANFETWLQEHPWTTLLGVSLLTVAQFSARVARTAAEPPVIAENKADARNE